MTTCSWRTPRTMSSATRSSTSRRTSSTAWVYSAFRYIRSLWPRQCMTTKPTPVSATTRDMSGSTSPPETSLTITAPSSTARSAVLAFIVSTLTAIPSETSCCTTGRTRSCSTSTGTRSAPGRVDSPPTSTRSAPVATRCRACASAASTARCRPPSLNESGVTLRIPITRVPSGVERPRRRPVTISGTGAGARRSIATVAGAAAASRARLTSASRRDRLVGRSVMPAYAGAIPGLPNGR